MNFLDKHSVEIVFVVSLIIYTLLIWRVSSNASQSKDARVAYENFPKAVNHITEGFVSIIIFLLLFYLTMTGIVPKEVLITLVSVFATAGFLSFKTKGN